MGHCLNAAYRQYLRVSGYPKKDFLLLFNFNPCLAKLCSLSRCTDNRLQFKSNVKEDSLLLEYDPVSTVDSLERTVSIFKAIEKQETLHNSWAALKKETRSSAEISTAIYKATWQCTPQNLNFYLHCYESPNS